MDSIKLVWPCEMARPDSDNNFSWNDLSTNRVLDFHGNPQNAGLTVLSDGNHHMALEATLQAFLKQHPELNDIFYVTLPPQVLNGILEHKAIQLANLKLDIHPDVYIGPQAVLNNWFGKNSVNSPRLFARSLGQAWLVRKGNPSGFCGVQDLLDGMTRIFISNPLAEKASHQVYHDTMVKLAQYSHVDAEKISQALSSGADWVMHGTHVHHREAPEALACGQADVTLVYYHLALRYTRIFPDVFDMIPLPGSGSNRVADFQEVTEYAVSTVKGSNEWAEPFSDFLCGPMAGECYRQHGLEHTG